MYLNGCWTSDSLFLESVNNRSREFHLLKRLHGRWYGLPFSEYMPLLPYSLVFAFRGLSYVAWWTPARLEWLSVLDSFG